MRRLACMMVLASLVACGPTEPYWHYTCAEFQTSTELVFWPGSTNMTPYGFGVNVGGSMKLVTKTTCASYDSVYVVPKVKK